MSDETTDWWLRHDLSEIVSALDAKADGLRYARDPHARPDALAQAERFRAIPSTITTLRDALTAANAENARLAKLLATLGTEFQRGRVLDAVKHARKVGAAWVRAELEPVQRLLAALSGGAE